MNPTYYYTSGNVFIKFTKIEEGAYVYINAGSDIRNMSKSFTSGNKTVKVGKEYKID
jgi:hypothetical protein